MLAATAALAVFSTRSPKTCRTGAGGLSGPICSTSSSLGLSRRSCRPRARAVTTAEEAYHWSDKRAVFASDSPFPPVEIGSFIAAEATHVTDEMFIAAAKAVAEQVTSENLAVGLIYPPQSRILDVSLHVAERIATYIFDRGLARVSQPPEIGALIRSPIYRPVYAG
jgi:malate dehydrogenase (oxaloacetate-decarboxylating)(NADP+)